MKYRPLGNTGLQVSALAMGCMRLPEHDPELAAQVVDAAIAAGVDPRDYTRHVDSVMFCLSKGLSCPLGSIVAGSKALISAAERARKQVGGGMRQAGVIAACGLVALRTMVDRLADDPRHAGVLARELSLVSGLGIDMESVQTNMVLVDHAATGTSNEEFVARLRTAGVLVSPRPPSHVRFVTNRHHDEATVLEAARRVRTALQ